MHLFFGFVLVAIVAFIGGVVFSGRIGGAIKSVEATLVTRLTAIETAIKKKI
jgi:hypothetical protein